MCRCLLRCPMVQDEYGDVFLRTLRGSSKEASLRAKVMSSTVPQCPTTTPRRYRSVALNTGGGQRILFTWEGKINPCFPLTLGHHQ